MKILISHLLKKSGHLPAQAAKGRLGDLEKRGYILEGYTVMDMRKFFNENPVAGIGILIHQEVPLIEQTLHNKVVYSAVYISNGWKSPV